MSPLELSFGLDTPNVFNDCNNCIFMFSPSCMAYNYKSTYPTDYNNRKWQIKNPYDKEDMLSVNGKRAIVQNFRQMPTIYL